MNKTTNFLIAILICFSTWSTSALAQKPTKKNNLTKEEFFVSGRSNISIGMFFPTGTLAKSLKPCPNIGYYYGLQISRKYSIDLGGGYFKQINPNDFNFKQADSVVVGKPTSSGKIGIWISRIEKLNKNYTWENRFGFGVSVLQSNIKKNSCNDSKDQFENSSSTFLNLGTTIRKKIKKEKDIGFMFNYYVTKYDLFNHDFATGTSSRNHYITMGISYGSNR